MSLAVNLQAESGAPLYRQLAEELRQCILSGRLRAGDPLPPTRELARSLGISRETVVRAYDDFISSGYAEVQSTKGTFITKAAELLQPGPLLNTTCSPSEQISEYSKRLSGLALLHPTSSQLPHLRFGASPPNLLPTSRWRQSLLKHCATSKELIYEQDVFGRLELRSAIVGYLSRTRGITCSPDQVVIFSQTQSALNVLLRLLLNPGDRIAVEEPGFGGIKNTALAQNLGLCPIRLDGDGISLADSLRGADPVKMIYVTPCHQDPTGTTMSLSQRQDLLTRAHKTGAWVIEDDFDSDFHYGANTPPPLDALDQNGRVIYLGSFWKMLYPLTAVGYIVVPPSLVALLRIEKAITEPNSEALEHLALADMLQSGFLERHRRRVGKLYAERRQMLLFQLKKAFGASIEIAKQSAGMHQLIKLDSALDEQTICELAAAVGLGLESTRGYFMHQPAKNEFLLNFACLEPERCLTSVKAFYNALRR